MLPSDQRQSMMRKADKAKHIRCVEVILMAIIKEYKTPSGATVRIHDDCILPKEQQDEVLKRFWLLANTYYRQQQERRIRDAQVRSDHGGH